MTSKAWATKEKLNKLDFRKILKFCALKDTTSELKRQPTEWKKYLDIIHLIEN